MCSVYRLCQWFDMLCELRCWLSAHIWCLHTTCCFLLNAIHTCMRWHYKYAWTLYMKCWLVYSWYRTKLHADMCTVQGRRHALAHCARFDVFTMCKTVGYVCILIKTIFTPMIQTCDTPQYIWWLWFIRVVRFDNKVATLLIGRRYSHSECARFWKSFSHSGQKNSSVKKSRLAPSALATNLKRSPWLVDTKKWKTKKWQKIAPGEERIHDLQNSVCLPYPLGQLARWMTVLLIVFYTNLSSGAHHGPEWE